MPTSLPTSPSDRAGRESPNAPLIGVAGSRHRLVTPCLVLDLDVFHTRFSNRFVAAFWPPAHAPDFLQLLLDATLQTLAIANAAALVDASGIIADAHEHAVRVAIAARLLAPPEFQGAFDPHLWFDVELWSYIVEPIRATLSEIDPAHAADYARNAEAYRRQLAEVPRVTLRPMYATTRSSANPTRPT